MTNDAKGAAEYRMLDGILHEDDLVAVMLGATYVEYALTDILRQSVPNPEIFGERSGGLQYRHLVYLAIAFNRIPADLRQPLMKLAEIRNSFAHNINTVLSNGAIQGFLDALPSEIRAEEFSNEAARFRRGLFRLCVDVMRCINPLHKHEDRRRYHEWFNKWLRGITSASGEMPSDYTVKSYLEYMQEILNEQFRKAR
jgi:hypothetical protein